MTIAQNLGLLAPSVSSTGTISYDNITNKPSFEIVPTITSLTYSGNDLAADTTNPLRVTIIGTGFEANSKVYIDTVSNANSATALQFSGTTQISFIPPAKSAASYNVWIVTPTGKMAVLVNGILYSGTPSWTGVASSYTSTVNVNIQLAATGSDTPLVYSLVSGTLPTGVTLSSGGLLSGTVTGLTADTNFPNIVIRADDPQNQDASITIQLNIQVRQQISRSLRFNSADSAYLTRTPPVAGNRKTWTLSWWVKRCKSGVNDELFVTGSSDGFVIRFVTDDTIRIYSWTGSYQLHLITSAVYRDLSAWYHIVFAVDTTQATDTNRAKLYINGTQVTAFSAAVYPTQNQDLLFNQTIQHSIGSNLPWGSTYSNIYMTEVNFIDGQQLTPSSFGETDPDTGVWRPKRYVGTYGTNGFYLNFADNTSATSLTLGKDTSSSGINRIELGNASSGYTVLGTMTFTGLLSANAVNLRDGNTSTFAADPNALNNGTTMGYDFGIAVPVRRIVTITAGTYGVDTSTIMNIQYSDDNSTWTTVTGATTQHNVTAGLGITNTTNISDNGSHRYWRLAVANGAPTGGNFWFSTLDMYASGIGPNGWYPINFSVASGAGNDSAVDSPTQYGTDTGLGGEVRGNYCTLNPLFKNSSYPTSATLANGNLDLTTTGGVDNYFAGTFSMNSGKWYYECLVTAVGSGFMTGIASVDSPNTANVGSYRNTGDIYNLSGNTQATSGATYVANDIIGVAIDIDAGTVRFYKNNVAQGANPSFSFTPGTTVFVRGRSDGSGASATFNFGQRPFAYSAPSGFKALCTQNLPTPTIGATSSTLANKYFDIVLRTGGAASYSTTVNMANGALLWDKPRSGASGTGSNYLIDSVRGISKNLKSNQSGDESTDTNWITSFNSGSFTTGSTDWGSATNIVDWIWSAGGTATTNTQGSITSTVSANTTSGFSIVSYTGTGNTGGTVGHGLGRTPALIIVKARNFGGATNWVVWSNQFSSPTSNVLILNTTDGTLSINNYWSASPPNSSVFGVNNGAWDNNHNGVSIIAYCFAEIPGYSRFGSYAGNNSTDGPFIYTGFRPRWIMIKRSDSAGENWRIIDTARGPYNVFGVEELYPNSNAAEGGAGTVNFIDALSNGFKLRNTGSGVNASGGIYIYAAFAETPFKYALAR